MFEANDSDGVYLLPLSFQLTENRKTAWNLEKSVFCIHSEVQKVAHDSRYCIVLVYNWETIWIELYFHFHFICQIYLSCSVVYHVIGNENMKYTIISPD